MKFIEGYNFSESKYNPRFVDIYKPIEPTKQAIVFLHGGAWKSGSPKQFDSWAKHFTKYHNFFCISLDYRLSGEAVFPAPVEDLNGVIRWIRKYEGIDRVIVIATSAGANIAATAMTSNQQYSGESGSNDFSNRIDLAVLLNGEFDMLNLMEDGILIDSINEYLGVYNTDKSDVYKLISPTFHVHSDLPKTLLMHGIEDKIPFRQSSDFHKRLVDSGNDSELHLIQGKGHNWFFQEGTSGETIKRVEEFILRK